MKNVVRRGWLAVWLACVTMVAVSCSGGAVDARGKLKTAVEDVQNKLPVSLGVTGEMSGVSFTDNVLTMHFKLAMPLDVDILKQNEELTKLSMATNFCLMDESQLQLFELVAEAGAELKLEIEGQDNETVAVAFSTSEMDAMLGGGADKSKLAYQYLTAQAELTQMQTPMVVDAVTTLDNVKLENMRFEYDYLVDDAAVDMDALEANKEAMRVNILQATAADPSSNIMKQRCDQAGVKMVYHYQGKTNGKALDIEL